MSYNQFKLSRRGRKLQIADDQKILAGLPREIAERTWAEVLQKEETDLMIFDLREEIIEMAIDVYYERYMIEQNVKFTVHCTAQAWLKLIGWHFFRHDPGEDTTAYPSCNVPRRLESWTPDEVPDPSPKDSWARHDLDVFEEVDDEVWPSISSSGTSLNYPVVQEIPEKYWFPGKVQLPGMTGSSEEMMENVHSYASSVKLAAESEVLQKVVDYSNDRLDAEESKHSDLKTTTPVQTRISLGGGDASNENIKKKKIKPFAPRKRLDSPEDVQMRFCMEDVYKKIMVEEMETLTLYGRPRMMLLPPLSDISDSRSKISMISDCRLRNLRVETQYEITSERLNTPPVQNTKRK